MLQGYLFYPEIEWRQFGYRPPENYILLGAWRDVTASVFIFLMEDSADKAAKDQTKLIVQAAGLEDSVLAVQRKVQVLKDQLAKTEARELATVGAKERLETEQRTRSVRRLIKLVGLFTVVVNAFSLYLRSLRLPDSSSPTFVDVYKILVSLIHLCALVLLLLITIIFIAYAARYGLLILRRI